MKERPMLFSGPMVRAILSGQKTQTRRAMKPQPHLGRYGATHPKYPSGIIGQVDGALGGGDYHVWDGPNACAPLTSNAIHVALNQCPYGLPGDRLYVREAWRSVAELDKLSGSGIADACVNAGYRLPWAPIQYEADEQQRNWMTVGTPTYLASPPVAGRYRHARFMPRWASRILLEITAVRVERLQDISEEDAHLEGVDSALCRESIGKSPLMMGACTQCGFAYLWDKVNGAGAWDSNPWVWAVEFRRVA